MVLLAVAIFSKDGKVLLSRQFVEMTRTRIEGLLTTFPKLIGKGKQHTFVETESVRYVYQPLEKLYILLLTTKASNILEDLETLRLFAKVIPEYSRSLDEYDIKENIFEIIFAFDEIVALGYRENVNLAQIKIFTEMDSQEEKVFLAIRETQEKETIENMKKKAKELQIKRDNAKGGNYHSGISNTGFGNSSNLSNAYSSPQVITIDTEKSVPTNKPILKSKISSRNTMRLGGKGHIADAFVDQLIAEGVVVQPSDEHRKSRNMSGSAFGGQANQSMVREGVHVRIEEKLKIQSSHNSGLANMELLGILLLRVSEKENNLIRLKVNLGNAGQLQTHPNVDKNMFQTSNILQAKSHDKAFLIGPDIGLLKWRYQTQDSDQMPLLINCWPNKTSNGCNVNIEYELLNTNLELHDVIISIALPEGAGVPVVKEVTGEYSVDAKKTHLLWSLPVIDVDNSAGSMDFDTRTCRVEDFFPLTVNFYSEKTFTGLKMVDVFDQSGNGVKFSSETMFAVDKYEIL